MQEESQNPNLPQAEVPPAQTHLEPIRKNWKKIATLTFLGFVLFTAIFYVGVRFTTKKRITDKTSLLTNRQISPTTPEPTNLNPIKTALSYSVIVKENSDDKTKTDIYLMDTETGQEIFFITLSDIYRNHYHNAEYHNGNLYIIHRTGGDSGYQINLNWIDELWRYNQQKQGQKLYSVRGLDFRVSDDEQLIVIITNEELNLLDNAGNKIKTFQSSEVIANAQENPMFGFLAWGPTSIWLDNTFGPSLTGLAKIDTRTYTTTKYDLTGLAAGPEFTINVYKEKTAFSNYPALLDVDSAEDYEKSGAKVNLVIYDLKTKTQQPIATSVTKRFDPRWIDQDILEFNNPDGEGRLTQKIK